MEWSVILKPGSTGSQVVLLPGITAHNIHGLTGMCLNLDGTKKSHSHGARGEKYTVNQPPPRHLFKTIVSLNILT